MQRKATKTTRGPDASEKRFMGWVKQHGCIVCRNPGPSIAHHCEGATFKHNKVLVGHWFLLPLCADCDDVVTRRGKPAFREFAQATQSALWRYLINEYEQSIPFDVQDAIASWGR